MAADRLDMVVFGASGYTGKHVVRELARIGPKYPALSWAVAGRSAARLQALLRDVQRRTGVDLSSTRVIEADALDESSLRAMCRQARVVLNCCGPFTKLGEPVVAAAIACGAHYVDVNGEKSFVEACESKFDESARAAGVCVVTACGLSSIPADLGVLHLQQNFGGTLNSVEAYLVIHFPPIQLAKTTRGVVMYSTWESMLTSISAMSLKKKFVQKPLSPQFEPQLKHRGFIHKNLNRWCLPFPGTDATVVNKTQRHLLSSNLKRPVQYKAYITFPSIFSVVGVVFIGTLLFLLSKVSCLRKLLLNYPRLCSFGIVTYDHPEEGAMNMCLQYQMLGEGWEEGSDVENTPPNKKIVGRVSVSGPDAAYVGTAVVVVHSALAVLQERNKMPKRGGAMTPGVAFRNTSLVKNLHENNVKFEIVTDQ